MYQSNRPQQVDDAIVSLLGQVDLEGPISSIGFLEWDVRSGVTSWDPSWSELFELPQGVLFGHAGEWEKTVHPDDLPGVMENLNDHLLGHTPFFNAEYRLAGLFHKT